MQRKSNRSAPAWHADAHRLAADGVSTKRIAERLGRSSSAVYKALNPQKVSEYCARRNADPEQRRRKAEWQRATAHLRRRLPEREVDPGIPGLLPVYYKNQIIDFVRVDFDVWERLRGTNLSFAARRQITGYAVFHGEDGQNVYLHHHILGYRPKRGSGVQTDHINRDSTDNRRTNLRLVTPRENCANRGGIFENAA